MWNSEMNHQFRVGCVYCDTSAIRVPDTNLPFLGTTNGESQSKVYEILLRDLSDRQNAGETTTRWMALKVKPCVLMLFCFPCRIRWRRIRW